MNGQLWTWVLEKAWKIDTNVLLKKGLISNGTKFENGTRLNREPMELFEEWHTI